MSRIFLSCVTREFGSYRTLLTKDLRRAEVDVRVQEDFGVGGNTLLGAIDDYIRECAAVIHLIGQSTGVFPEVLPVRALLARYPDIATKIPSLAGALAQSDPRIAYTQWEAYLAIYHGREIHFYFPSDRAPRGPDVIANDEERRSQDEHFRRIEALGRSRGPFDNEERLSSHVLADLHHILPPGPEPFVAAPTKLPKKHDSGVFEGRESNVAALDALWADTLADKPGRGRIISLVAIGGAGKTALASRWKDALLARAEHGGVERYFDWSFYAQGTRHEGDQASAQTAGDATVFIAAALKFFGDPSMADSTAPAWDKGARLADLVAKHRTLLILDGLEPLQHPPGPQTGEIKDDAILALFAALQIAGRGLCVVTTRESIADLAATRDTVTPEWLVDHLSETAGALVLARHGVVGPDADRRRASAEVKGHALTLSLMGRYLALAFDPPDISKRDCFRFADVNPEVQNGHAFRVFAAYERWLEEDGRHVELAILRLLGLFDRAATPDCLAALCAAPAIPGLTEQLVGLAERQWTAAVQRLVKLDLVEAAEWTPVDVSGYAETEARAEMAAARQGRSTVLGCPPPFENRHSRIVNRTSLDAHQILRAYFGAQLKESGIAPAGHVRIYEHLCASVPYWPEGRAGLLPLYQAVAHGCKAGRIEEARAAVYHDRIKRGSAGSHANYSSAKLGLFGLDLAAVAGFFAEPWGRLRAELSPDAQAWLFNEAALHLRALNRNAEAKEPTLAAIDISEQLQDWRRVAIGTRELSELELTLGDVPAAEAAAMRSMTVANQSDKWQVRMGGRIAAGNALHQAGKLAESETLFAEAEVLQANHQPDYPRLYSVRGHLYCDLLLSATERVTWQRLQTLTTGQAQLETEEAAFLADIEHRAAEALAIAQRQGDLLSVALDYLTLGRVHLRRAVLRNPQLDTSNPEWLRAHEFLTVALSTMRLANTTENLPSVLLSSAWWHALTREWDAARQRLDEAFALATRGGKAQNAWHGGMRLHLIDTLLHRARLFGSRRDEAGALIDYAWPGRTPAIDLAEAADLIAACGYHRRDEELADAQAAFATQPQG